MSCLWVLVADTWGRNVAQNVLVYDMFNNIVMGTIREFLYCVYSFRPCKMC